MFSKILIANRGEIACRIIRTAQDMGISSVAVYSEADAYALHVRMADEAVAIGPAAAAESYLVIDKIVAAARRTGAEAVHPGYGFLAENAAFVRALADAEVGFIGPDDKAIAAMGDKLESKRLAENAGVNTIPGHDGIIADSDEAVAVAVAIGYPVMLKATAGGGGKGMRFARDETETRKGFAQAASEARSSFGDDRILIEKFVEQPRHIEIQVLADGHGNCIHLGERECSIQRRHQKVIEESPSPFLDAETRAAMGAQAVALAKAVDYRSAGTVEFIVDGNKNFYFLEMNTRLQVEHPVTELVTGIDLVEQMIRVAAGEMLTLTQSDVTVDGWAVEARIYAEEPSRGFLPAPGRLVRYRPPETVGARVDTGVFEGAEVSLYYDPMVAKLCAHGANRDQAIERLGAALNAFEIAGPGNNLAFLAAVMGHPRFMAGNLTTAFIDDEYGETFGGVALTGELLETLLATAALVQLREDERSHRISGRVAGVDWSPNRRWGVNLGGDLHVVEASLNDVGAEVTVGEQAVRLSSAWRPGETLLQGTIQGRAVTVRVNRQGEGYRLCHGGADVVAVARPERATELAATMPVKAVPDRSRYLLSPMPGRVVSIIVEAGQAFKAGDALCVVDAMKMENVLRAERDGQVAKIVADAGDSVSVDQVILELE